MKENARKGVGEGEEVRKKGVREVERKESVDIGTWLLETFCITLLSRASTHGRS